MQITATRFEGRMYLKVGGFSALKRLQIDCKQQAWKNNAHHVAVDRCTRESKAMTHERCTRSNLASPSAEQQRSWKHRRKTATFVGMHETGHSLLTAL